MRGSDRDEIIDRLNRRRDPEPWYEIATCAVMALLFVLVAATFLAFGPDPAALGR